MDSKRLIGVLVLILALAGTAAAYWVMQSGSAGQADDTLADDEGRHSAGKPGSSNKSSQANSVSNGQRRTGASGAPGDAVPEGENTASGNNLDNMPLDGLPMKSKRDWLREQGITPPPSPVPAPREGEAAPAITPPAPNANGQRQPADAKQAWANRLGATLRISQSTGNRRPNPVKLDSLEAGKLAELERAKAGLRPGLFGQYWGFGNTNPIQQAAAGANPTDRAPDMVRIDNAVNFPRREDFGSVAASSYFVARWTGLLNVPEEALENGALTLVFGSDAGAVVIDNQAVALNDNFNWWYVELFAAMQLTAGLHTLTVEFVETPPSNGAANRDAACRLMYVKPGEAEPRVVPDEWYLMPPELAQAPVITGISPGAIEVGQQIQIEGQNFGPNSGLTAEGTLPLDSPLFGSGSDVVEVYVDGVRAEIDQKFEYSDDHADALRVTIPPGAGSGFVEVRRSGLPSNRWPITVTTRFGLVVSVWDLTGYPLGFVNPDDRPPDFVVLDEKPFPLTPDKFPQFAGKPIAVRCEGEVALGAEMQPIPTNDLQVQYVLKFGVDGKPESVRYSVLGQAGVDRLPNAIDGKPVPTALLPGIEVSCKENERRWLPVVVDGVFEAGKPAIPITVRLGVSAATPRTPDFKPSFIPPEPPLLMLRSQFWNAVGNTKNEADPSTGESPSVGVGGEIVLWASDAPAGYSLSFSVDGVPTTGRDVTQVVQSAIEAGVQDKPVQVVMEQGGKKLRPWAITIPDGAGEGMIRARLGIVQSEPVQIKIANRGLTGFYYDFDEPLNTIPNMEPLTPVMRRVDKKIEFANNTDFRLPMAAERFGVEWFGSIRVPATGEYTFILQSDDGARLTINDAAVVEWPGLRAPSESQGKIYLTPGWHDVRLEFFENDINENCELWWIPPGKAARERIATKDLSTDRVRGVPDKGR